VVVGHSDRDETCARPRNQGAASHAARARGAPSRHGVSRPTPRARARARARPGSPADPTAPVPQFLADPNRSRAAVR